MKQLIADIIVVAAIVGCFLVIMTVILGRLPFEVYL